MMNSRILLSAASIAAAGALIIGATFAYFSDVGTSSGNTFAAGTLNLQLDDNNESARESVTGSITASNFAPGQSVSSFISLHNPGSLPIAEVEMTADTSETADPGANSDLRNVLLLTVVEDNLTPDSSCVGGANITSSIDNQVGNNDGTLRLIEFDDGTDVFDSISGMGVGTTRNVCFTVTFESTAGDIYQGDAVDTTLTFTANQDVSQ